MAFFYQYPDKISDFIFFFNLNLGGRTTNGYQVVGHLIFVLNILAYPTIYAEISNYQIKIDQIDAYF